MNNAEAAKSNAQASYWIAPNKRKGLIWATSADKTHSRDFNLLATKSQIHERNIENVRYINNLGTKDKRFTQQKDLIRLNKNKWKEKTDISCMEADCIRWKYVVLFRTQVLFKNFNTF